MARSISSSKRQRQSLVRSERNKSRRSQIKTAVRKVNEAILKRDVPASETALQDAFKLLDRNGNRRTIHPNTAARRKSRLARRLNALKASVN